MIFKGSTWILTEGLDDWKEALQRSGLWKDFTALAFQRRSRLQCLVFPVFLL